MVNIAVSERGVKESFLRVKKDVNTLKRSINREILKEEELSKAAGQFTTKEEFYAFVRTLKDKLDSIEAGFAHKEHVEQGEAALRSEVKALRRELERIDALRDELLESRKLKDSFGQLEAKALSKSEFTGELKRLHEELNGLKKDVSKTSRYQRYQDDIAELRKTLSAVERQQAGLKEMQVAHKKLADRAAESAKSAEEELAIIRENIETLSGISVSKEALRDDLAPLRKSLSKIEDSLSNYAPKKDALKKTDWLGEEILKLKKALNELKGAEVDAGDLVTKRELAAALKTGAAKEERADSLPNLPKVEKRLRELEQRISGKEGENHRKLFRNYENSLNELKGKIMDTAKKHESRFEELERDVFSAMDAGDENVSKARNEIKELSNKVDGEVDEVRKDIVEAAKDLVKDLDKKYSQKIHAEITKAALAPEKDMVAEIAEIRRLAEKGGGKATEKQKEEFSRKLNELEEALSSEIEDLHKKLDKTEERALEKAKAEFTKKLNLLEQTFLSEIESLQPKKGGKDAEKIRSEIMKKLDEMEERLYADIEETAAKKVKELESKFTPVDAFSGDLEKRFSKVEEKLESRKETKDIEKRLKQSEDALIAEAEGMVRESEEKHTSRFRQIEAKTYGRINEIELKLKNAEKKIFEYVQLRDEIKKISSKVDAQGISEVRNAQEKGRKELLEIIAISAKDIEKLNSELKKLQEQKKAPSKDRQYADIRKEVDYLLNNVVTNPDLDAQVNSVEEKISELRKELKNSQAARQQGTGELIKRIAALEKRLAEGKKEAGKQDFKKEKKSSRSSRSGSEGEPGILSKALAGIASFFREEPEPEPKIEVREIKDVKEEKKAKEERKEAKAEAAKEARREEKKEEKIEDKPNTLKHILIGFIILLVLGGAAYYLLQPPEAVLTADEACILNYECKTKEQNQYWFGCAYNSTQGSCRCYVGQYEQCDAAAAAAAEQKRDSARRLPSTVYALLDYKFYILGIIIVMGLIIYLMTRSPKEKEMEYEEEEEEEKEEALDLDEFLGKNPEQKKYAKEAKDTKKEEAKKEQKGKNGAGKKIKDFFFEEEEK